MRRLAPALLLLASVLATAGCGAAPGDLFAVTRSGRDPNANVRLVVSDGGTVTCDRREPRALPARQLLVARELARDLSDQARLGLDLPPGPGSTLRYRAELATGTVAFSDRSRHLPESFLRLAAFTKDVAEGVCGIRR
jgi:hypothetical protein